MIWGKKKLPISNKNINSWEIHYTIMHWKRKGIVILTIFIEKIGQFKDCSRNYNKSSDK